MMHACMGGYRWTVCLKPQGIRTGKRIDGRAKPVLLDCWCIGFVDRCVEGFVCEAVLCHVENSEKVSRRRDWGMSLRVGYKIPSLPFDVV